MDMQIILFCATCALFCTAIAIYCSPKEKENYKRNNAELIIEKRAIKVDKDKYKYYLILEGENSENVKVEVSYDIFSKYDVLDCYRK